VFNGGSAVETRHVCTKLRRSLTIVRGSPYTSFRLCDKHKIRRKTTGKKDINETISWRNVKSTHSFTHLCQYASHMRIFTSTSKALHLRSPSFQCVSKKLFAVNVQWNQFRKTKPTYRWAYARNMRTHKNKRFKQQLLHSPHNTERKTIYNEKYADEDLFCRSSKIQHYLFVWIGLRLAHHSHFQGFQGSDWTDSGVWFSSLLQELESL